MENGPAENFSMCMTKENRTWFFFEMTDNK